MEENKNLEQNLDKSNEKLHISDVSERFNQKIDERISKLQSDWNYYTKPRRFRETFSYEAQEYYKSIPIRLLELEWILKNVH